MFVSLAFKTSTNWPTEQYIFSWSSSSIEATPETDELLAQLDIEVATSAMYPDDSELNQLIHTAGSTMRSFLSALCWSTGQSFQELHLGASASKSRWRKGSMGTDSTPIDLAGIVPPTKLQATGLAFYREALNATSTPLYQYLCYFKIFEQANGKTSAQWINDTILQDQRLNRVAAEYAQRIGIPPSKLGDHIYERGRCAIAHFSKKGLAIIDPDDVQDELMAREGVFLIQLLAKKYIKDFLSYR